MAVAEAQEVAFGHPEDTHVVKGEPKELCHGPLKFGAANDKSLLTRYFTLVRSSSGRIMLFYAKHAGVRKSGHEPGSGGFRLVCDSTVEDHRPGEFAGCRGNQHEFVLHLAESIVLFRADTEADKQMWMEKIEEAIHPKFIVVNGHRYENAGQHGERPERDLEWHEHSEEDLELHVPHDDLSAREVCEARAHSAHEDEFDPHDYDGPLLQAHHMEEHGLADLLHHAGKLGAFAKREALIMGHMAKEKAKKHGGRAKRAAKKHGAVGAREIARHFASLSKWANRKEEQLLGMDRVRARAMEKAGRADEIKAAEDARDAKRKHVAKETPWWELTDEQIMAAMPHSHLTHDEIANIRILKRQELKTEKKSWKVKARERAEALKKKIKHHKDHFFGKRGHAATVAGGSKHEKKKRSQQKRMNGREHYPEY
jgi:hypothetical protein